MLAAINDADYSISVTVPFSTDLTALTVIVKHTGVNISPESFVEQNFMSSVIYTVTAEDGTAQDYTVTVVEATGGLLYSLINDDKEAEVTTGVDESNIIIPDFYNGKKITAIGVGAFLEYSSITNIIIPNGVTFIGMGAFKYCTSLTGLILPKGTTFIGGGAFCNCEDLKNFNIPSGVTSISDLTFAGCRSLEEVTIPAAVTSIGDFAFDGCQILTSITIPAAVTHIGERAFGACYRLTSLSMEPIIAPSPGDIGDEPFGYGGYDVTHCTLHIKAGASGYDVPPWTDTDIFSSIVEDL